MPWFLSTVLSIQLLSTLAPTDDALSRSVPRDQWVPAAGQELIVDTERNTGYIVDPNGIFTSFPVVTGRNEFIWWIGRYYKATTPEDTWVVQRRDIKGNRIVFGASGRFLRLFSKEGKNYTSYGIHSYAYIDKWISLPEEERFKSPGCILVTEDILDVIDAVYAANDNSLRVTTSLGIDKLAGKLLEKQLQEVAELSAER